MIINKNTFLPNTHDPENTAKRRSMVTWSHGHHCHFTFFAVNVKLKLSSSRRIRRRFRALSVAESKHISAR